MTMEPLVITVAPNGARRTRADHPALPITPEELASTARACLEAGAAMLHLHVRDRQERHTLDAEAYRRAIDAVREAVGERLIIQVTTEAVGQYSSAEQMALVRELRPEAVSLALREIVPDPSAEDEVGAFFAWLAEEPILPQLILYTLEDLECYQELRDRGVLPDRGHSLLLVLGRYATEQEATPQDLLPLLSARDDAMPWAACAFGPREHACCSAAAALGGHVRVGFENNLALRTGGTAPDNAALVRQMRELADALGRPVADADAARALLKG